MDTTFPPLLWVRRLKLVARLPIRRGPLKMLFTLVALLAFRWSADGQELPPGDPLISPDSLTAFSVSDNGGGARREFVSVTGQTFNRAMRVSVARTTADFWGVELRAPTIRSVQAGDVAMLHFFVRAEASQDENRTAFVWAYSQKASADWDKSLFVQIAAVPEWQEIFLPFEFIDGYASRASEIVFGLGGSGPQTVDLGGIEAIYYGRSLEVSDLPSFELTYPGRSLDAAWRAEAEERIEAIRKADLEIRIEDADGLPVSDAAVEVTMQRHAFPFGTAVQARRVVGGDLADRIAYRAHLTDWFNAASLENNLKWPPWEGDWGAAYSQETALQALAWLHDRDFELRGHVLVWPGWDHLPLEIQAMQDSPTQIPGAVLAHIRDITETTATYVNEWDVVNEPVNNDDLMRIFGDRIMVDWFREARTMLPEARLFLNDFGVINEGGNNRAKQDAVVATIRYLLDQGAPLTGIGIQGHFGSTLTGPERLFAILDRFAEFDLPIRITEFDIAVGDELLQADYTRDFLTAIFSHPAVAGFQLWGFWEDAHWRPEAAFFRSDWSAKPNAVAYHELVYENWWTESSGISNAEGRLTIRGFHGRYLASVAYEGHFESTEFDLGPEDTSVVISLPGLHQAPHLTVLRDDSTLMLRIQWLGRPKNLYQLMESTDLTHWTPLDDPILGVDDTMEAQRPIPPEGTSVFYRLLITTQL